MPMIAVDFLQKLLNSFDEVKKDVEDYLCKFKQPIWCKGSTRIGNQCRVLLLVVFLTIYSYTQITLYLSYA